MHNQCTVSLHLASVISLVLLIFGCSTVTMRGTEESALNLENEEAIVMIMSNHSGVSPKKLSSSFREIETCVAETVREVSPSMRVVMADEFRRMAFPGLDFEEIPRDQEYILPLIKDQGFLETIAPLKLKYLLTISGNTTGLLNKSGDIVCGGGYGGAGCLGLAVWDKTASLQASIIDVKHASQVGELEVNVTGKPWLAVVGFIPVGLPAFPEYAVCVELGRAVSKTIKIDANNNQDKEVTPGR